MAANEANMPPFIVKWNEEGVPPRKWFIRGIGPDGRFYGELIEGRWTTTIQGIMSESDYNRLFTLIEGIERASPKPHVVVPWQGLLAEGPIATGRVIYTYPESDARTSKADLLFPELIAIMTPY